MHLISIYYVVTNCPHILQRQTEKILSLHTTCFYYDYPPSNKQRYWFLKKLLSYIGGQVKKLNVVICQLEVDEGKLIAVAS